MRRSPVSRPQQWPNLHIYHRKTEQTQKKQPTVEESNNDIHIIIRSVSYIPPILSGRSEQGQSPPQEDAYICTTCWASCGSNWFPWHLQPGGKREHVSCAGVWERQSRATEFETFSAETRQTWFLQFSVIISLRYLLWYHLPWSCHSGSMVKALSEFHWPIESDDRIPELTDDYKMSRWKG